MRNELILKILIQLGGTGSQLESRNTLLNKILVVMGGGSVNGTRNEILEAIANV
jgi:hypothetical protein